MDISNKTLSILLIGAIVVSLGGTFISINKLESFSTTGYQTAGENVTGSVKLSIEEKLSITLEDSPEINFGTCQLKEDSVGILINSERTNDTSTNCLEFLAATPIAVRNNGNIDAEVLFNVSKYGLDEGGEFLNTGDVSSLSSLRYKLKNTGWSGGEIPASAGCFGNLGPNMDSNDMANYVVFSNTSLINACTNLTAGSSNSLIAHFEIKVPNSASQGDNVTITFVAQVAS